MSSGPFGPFATVLDVGGNVGEFAESCRLRWPDARIVSFEPIPELARLNEERAQGRWRVVAKACSSRDGQALLHVCENQHSASTMQQPGAYRARHGIRDSYVPVTVPTMRLDGFPIDAEGPLLIKVDVEGHERAVLEGAGRLLDRTAAVLCEVNQAADVFVGSPPPGKVDEMLRAHGLYFVGIDAVLLEPGTGRVVQFDGLWLR